MKVLIVGGGLVGLNTASRLSKERHDVTLIDSNPETVRLHKSRLDAQVVEGNGISIDLLEQLGIDETDLFIAVTDRDEVNLVACLLASEFGVKNIVARMKTAEYTKEEWKRNAERIGIKAVINPDQVVAEELAEVIGYPQATEVIHFAKGRVVFLGYPVHEGDALAGISIRTLGAIRGLYRMVVTAITRGDTTIVPRGDDEIRAGDVVHFVCKPEDLPAISDMFGFSTRKAKKIWVLGATRYGRQVAQLLANRRYEVIIVERDKGLCERAAADLTGIRVLNAAGTDVDILKQEGIQRADVFMATTGDDQTNILCALLAKQQGVREVIALIDRPELVRLATSLKVDTVVSPRLATASAILKHVRKGEIVTMAVVDQSDSEVMEMVVPADAAIAGKPLESLRMPRNAIVGAIVRKDEVIIPSGLDKMEPGDHVVVFARPDAITQVEDFFR